jgi:hypothetical protein
MAFNNVKDVVNGGEGTAFATINGNIENLAYIKKVEAKVEKNKEDVLVLGRRGTGSKAKGWKGSGTLTIYYVTSIFRQLMNTYNKTGKDTYFDIQVTNEDKGSATGKQTVVLKNCNIDSVILTKMDLEATAMDDEVSFTFDDYEILDSFTEL